MTDLYSPSNKRIFVSIWLLFLFFQLTLIPFGLLSIFVPASLIFVFIIFFGIYFARMIQTRKDIVPIILAVSTFVSIAFSTSILKEGLTDAYCYRYGSEFDPVIKEQNLDFMHPRSQQAFGMCRDYLFSLKGIPTLLHTDFILRYFR